MGLIHRLVSPVAVGQKNKIQNFGNVQNFEFSFFLTLLSLGTLRHQVDRLSDR